HNKTPYELIIGIPPSISFMRPFGCPVTILNTLDPLGKFEGKAEEGFLVGYSVNSKAFRVFNSQTKKVEENLHVKFLKNKPNIAGQGPNWIFDIDSLTNSMNYQPVTVGNQTNKNAGPQEANGDTGLKKSVDARQSEEKNVSTQQYIVFPLWSCISSSYKSSDETYKNDTADDAVDQEKEASAQSDAVRKEFEAQCNRELLQGKATKASSINSFNTVSTPVNTVGGSRIYCDAGSSFVPLSKFTNLPDDPLMSDLEDTVEVPNTGIFDSTFNDEDLDTYNSPFIDQVMGAEADFNNMEPSTVVSHIPKTRIHSIHPKDQIIGDPKSAVQTRGMSKKNYGEHAMINDIIFGSTKKSLCDDFEQIMHTIVFNVFNGRTYFLLRFTSQAEREWGLHNSGQTKIHVDNESAICIVKNHVYHSKTKHIEIKHHFIRDSFEKRLIEMVKIHTDQNVADLLTKAFDVSRFNFLVASIDMDPHEFSHVYLVFTSMLVMNRGMFHIKRGRDTKVPQSGGLPKKVVLRRFHKELGTVCLPNHVIFEELAKIGAKTTAWNEFSSTMASAIICLANNQKFNFSKYVLDNMVKNLKGGVKFFMFPRFMQVFLDKQVEGMSKHKETFIISSHTKKVFANIRRQSEGFSGVVTPLFDTMMVQASDEVGEDSDHPTDSNKIPIDTQPSTSKPQKKHKPKRKQRKEAEVLDLEKCKTDQAIEIASLKKRFKKLEMKRKSRPAVNDLHGEEVTVEDTAGVVIVKDTAAPIIPVTTAEVVTTVSAPTTSIEELTLAQTLIEIKASKPKTIKAVTTAATSVTIVITTAATLVSTAAVIRPRAKGIVFHDQE
ncbi:ribonuclease H-like domain-containing protein, partial [Tanacetum coccineum]